MKHLSSRISRVTVFVCALSLLIPVAIGSWQSRSSRRRSQGPTAMGFPPTLSGPQLAQEINKSAVDSQNQLEIRLNVQRVYALATELKDEVDQTDSTQVFSMSVVKRAQDIEKLAKQIKDRAKH